MSFSLSRHFYSPFTNRIDSVDLRWNTSGNSKIAAIFDTRIGSFVVAVIAHRFVPALVSQRTKKNRSAMI
jgi:hypothetical protein